MNGEISAIPDLHTDRATTIAVDDDAKHRRGGAPPKAPARRTLRADLLQRFFEALPATLPEAIQPLVGDLAAHACGASRPGHGPALIEYSADEQSAGLGGQLRVRMELHLRSPFGGHGWSQPHFLRRNLRCQ
jgi:hypothetical protein